MTIRVAPVQLQLDTTAVQDVAGAVRAGLQALPLRALVTPGMRVAVAVGSRGISCITQVVRTLLSELQAAGAAPFLVPAMGSHGGGTAEGQYQVLESYGLGPNDTGVEIRSCMDVVQLGTTADGMPVYFDTHASQADGIIIVNRIKEHTAFKGRWESGIFKMLAIGLGKERGAATIHAFGLADGIPSAARLIMEHRRVLGAIAIVENGNHEPAEIAVLPANQIETREPELLDRSRYMSPKIPREIEPLDLLVVREIGKDISGTGMDLNVIGMWRRTGGPVTPQIAVIAALDLTERSHGNAIGIGHADLITRRLYDQVDLAATYTNCLTSRNLAGAKIPITLPSDREVIAAGIGQLPPERARLAIIRNTLDMHTIWVSEPLLPAVHVAPTLQQVGDPRPLAFSDDGTLVLD